MNLKTGIIILVFYLFYPVYMVAEFLQNNLSYERSKYENILEDPRNKVGNYMNKFISFLVFAFVVVLTLESVGNFATYYQTQIFVFDAFVSSVFAGEYIYRLFRAKRKAAFFVNPSRIVDLFSFLPFFLGFFAVGGYLVVLRLLRVFRVLRLVKKIPLTAGFIKSLKDYLDEYRAVYMLFFVILFIGSFFVYFAEKDVVGTKFTSIPVSMWWGLVTMTTVGFGDMYPVTPLGRMFGSFLVFLGPVILALASAITIMVFMETSRNHEMNHQHHLRAKHCKKCKGKNPKEANYCMVCGDELL